MQEQFILTQEQIQLVANFKKIHNSHIDLISPAEDRALETLVQGLELPVNMLPRLVDFFGRLVDFNIMDIVDDRAGQFIFFMLKWVRDSFRSKMFD